MDVMDVVMYVLAVVGAYFTGKGIGAILYGAWKLGTRWIGRDHR